MAYVDFIYGLAFFSLGLVIGLESFRPITADVKPAFRSLAAFGLLYAVHQWTEVALTVLKIEPHPYSVVIFDITIMALAVLFLARFSALLVTDRWQAAVGLPVALLFIWVFTLVLNVNLVKDADSFHTFADDLARYALILPANVLAAWGLFRGRLMAKLGDGNIRVDRLVLGWLFIANAFFSGLLVNRARIFPALWLNNQGFLAVTGVPVPLVRAFLAVGITVFMVRALRVFEFTFLKERLAKETMESDAKIASEIQMELVPKVPLAAGGARVQARLLPARIVGGDTFDYFAAENILTFMIGDASGKGSPAALLCTAGLMTLESEWRSGDRPKEILRAANKRLVKRFPDGSFMTATMGRYFPAEHILELASAGQNPPLVYRHTDRVWRLLDLPGSLPLGVEMVAEPVEARVAVSTGDRLIFYTDGLIDVRTPGGERVGFDAVLDWLNANVELGPRDLLDRLIEHLLGVSGGELYDDVTVLLVNVESEKSVGSPQAA